MVEINDLTFWYEKNDLGAALKHINLTVRDGEVLVLCGKSGCGKTSITRLINGLIPHFYEGKMEGTVFVNGIQPSEVAQSKTAELVGSVFQNPRSQFFNVDTTSELAFGCENQGMEREQIQSRVNEAEAVLKLNKLMDRDIFELSGGEKQQIACGSIYAMHPEIVVLDEPSSNLDTAAIMRLQKALRTLKQQGKTIIISEHRLYYLMGLADRFVYMDAGEIRREYSAKQFASMSNENLAKMGLRCTNLENANRADENWTYTADGNQTPAIEVSKLICRRGDAAVLSIPSLRIPRGSIVALVGGNGAGKSTLAECLCGILPCMGEIKVDGKVSSAKQRTQMSYMVMQDVNHQLFCDSVKDEILLKAPEGAKKNLSQLLERMDLTDFAERHPASLSGGQKQRTAICAAICAGKQIVFYDEPTSGLDYDGMARLSSVIKEAQPDTMASIIITHDLELVLECCTHVLELQDGNTCAIYPLDTEGVTRVKEFFVKKGGSRVRENVKPATHPTGLGRLMEIAMKKKALIIPSAILSALSSIAAFIPFICIYLIVRVITMAYPDFDGVSGAAIMRYGMLAFGGIALNIVLYYLSLFLSHLAAFGSSYDLKINFTSYLAKLPLGFHLNYGSGRLRKIAENNIGQIEDFISHQFPDLIAAIVAPITMIVLLFAMDWRYGLVSMVGIVLAYVVQMSSFSGASVQEMMKKAQSAQEDMNNAAVEYVRGITVVKAFHQTVYSFKRLYNSIKDYTNFVIPYNLKFENSNSLYTALIYNLYLFLIPLILLVGMGTAQGNYSSFASTTIFYLIFVPSIASVMTKAMYSTSKCMQVSSCVDRMDEVLDTPPLPEPEAATSCSGGDIIFSDVSFRYDEKRNAKALNHVSFAAPQGKTTAVVGPSGSGKSTIAYLIPRFYDVNDGEITINGTDIRDISTENLMYLVSFVFQDVFLFQQSIFENIRMGSPSATREQVVAAAKAAQCDRFITALPYGYDTVYGKDGVYLSGGEKQRVAIARAIVKNAPVLVLDEATAFSDPENEHLIQQALTTLMNGKTVIMIAHRLSTVKNADNILVMEKGLLIEQGTHSELLERGGKYYQMWETYTQTMSWKMRKGAN